MKIPEAQKWDFSDQRFPAGDTQLQVMCTVQCQTVYLLAHWSQKVGNLTSPAGPSLNGSIQSNN